MEAQRKHAEHISLVRFLPVKNSYKLMRGCAVLSQVNLYPVLWEPFTGEGEVAPETGTLMVESLNLIGVRVTALEAPGHEIGDCGWRCMGAPGPEAESVGRALRCLDMPQADPDQGGSDGEDGEGGDDAGEGNEEGQGVDDAVEEGGQGNDEGEGGHDAVDEGGEGIAEGDVGA